MNEIIEPVELVGAGMWDTLAASWDDRGEWHARATAPLTEAMLGALEAEPGDTVVELACGPTADVAFGVEKRLPGQCRIVASDVSEPMVSAARRRGARAGSAVEFRVLDADRIDLPPASVDRLACRWAYMLLPDPGHALGEASRVLRDGGRCVFGTFAEAERNPFFMLPAGILIERGLLAPPRPGQPSMFALADTAATIRLTESAGFRSASAREVPFDYAFSDADDLWSFVSEFSGPIALTLGRLDESERVGIRRELESRATPFRRGSGFVFPSAAVLYVATKEQRPAG